MAARGDVRRPEADPRDDAATFEDFFVSSSKIAFLINLNASSLQPFTSAP